MAKPRKVWKAKPANPNKMNTCLKRAQRATMRAMLPGETAAQARERFAPTAKARGDLLHDAHHDPETGRWRWVRNTQRRVEA